MTYRLCDNGEVLEVVETDHERVVQWREVRLLADGWSAGFARQIAGRRDIDVEAARRLLVLGCDQRTAWRILR